MKTIKFIRTLCIAGIALSLAGCSLLDVDESSGKMKEDAYAYFENLKALSGHVYSGLSSDFGDISGALRESATDNALYSQDKHAIYNVYNNLWSPRNTIDNVWSKYYEYIRSANSFLENFDIKEVERFEYTDNYNDILVPSAKMYPNEVRFLRAYYYFELTKRYGDIPLLTETYTIDNINGVEKESFKKVIEFIVHECDEIAPALPISHQEKTTNPDGFLGETGRATRGAAMALKARALLYAASELHNPGNADPNLWKQAAQASLDIIDAGWYSLDGEANDPLFTKSANGVLTSKQLILERRNGQSNSFEQRNLPYGLQDINASGRNVPTQNLVDSYEFKNGDAFDWNNPAHVADPYTNRDPRLYRNVRCNGLSYTYNKQTFTLQTVTGGLNYSSALDAVNTGYYLNRYIDPSVTLVKGFETEQQHHYPLFRYAEVLLNYAEAVYQVTGSSSGTTAELDKSAEWALNEVRNAAAMPAKTGFNMNYIRDERRRELAFEDHRFWDIRRWKIGSVVTQINKVDISVENAVTKYQKAEVLPKRIWDDKMYLYPIPENETFINPNLGQNTGWSN